MGVGPKIAVSTTAYRPHKPRTGMGAGWGFRGFHGVHMKAEACGAARPPVPRSLHDVRQHAASQDGSPVHRSEEHTSELQSLMRISYAVFCLKKKKAKQHKPVTNTHI